MDSTVVEQLEQLQQKLTDLRGEKHTKLQIARGEEELLQWGLGDIDKFLQLAKDVHRLDMEIRFYQKQVFDLNHQYDDVLSQERLNKLRSAV
jgi:hypothetical protein